MIFKTWLSEAKFTSWFLKNFRDEWGWAYKLPDIWRTIKPFDFFWINKDWVHFCEVKVIEKWVFKFSQLRDNQYTALYRTWDIVKKYSFQNFIKTYVLLYDKWSWEFFSVDFKEVLEIEKKGENRIIMKKVLT